MSTAVLATAPALAAAHFGPGFGFGGGWLFLLIPLFWIALFAVLFATVGRRWRRAAWAHRAGGFDQPGRRAEATLAERFAQGDIDEVEYRARLEVIRTNNPAPQFPGR
ncbi:SHOCT domain-containing protein [Herbiconiux sp. YIM B11900]|uniref:SHOCT domain-containing protein n=1 Tax=Herbiconiux sp. YIM B11900 TaxID=3404131 RepID=UPI003F8301A0